MLYCVVAVDYNDTFHHTLSQERISDFIPLHTFIESLANYEQNAFVQFLYSQFETAEIQQVLEKYIVGTTKNEGTIF